MKNISVIFLFLVLLLSSCFNDNETDESSSNETNVVQKEEDFKETKIDSTQKVDKDDKMPEKIEETEVKAEEKLMDDWLKIDSADKLTYENSDLWISFKYPSDWEIQEDYLWIPVFLFSPATSDEDEFMENFNVLVQDLSWYNGNLEEYSKASIDYLKKSITNMEILKESYDLDLSWDKAFSIKYSWDQWDYKAIWYQVWTMKNNNAYILTFISTSDEYKDYSDTFDAIVNSFKID